MREVVAAILRRVVLAWGGIMGLAVAMSPQAEARIDPAAPLLEQHRAILDGRMARARTLLERDVVPPTAVGKRIAQWPNWPNYWSNWPNWRNFR